MVADRAELLFTDAERFARSAGGGAICKKFPDLEGEGLVFTWDADGPDDGDKQPFVIRHGEHALWRGVVLRGHARRFLEVAALLASRYGARAKDLVPSESPRLFLAGEGAEGPALIEAARARLREGWSIAPTPKPT
jgi:hypothetical protein